MADQQPFRVAGNGVDELRQRPVGFTHGAFYNIRDQVFHALFHRLAIIYSRSVSRSWRRTFEFFMLFEAITGLVILTYVHFAFNRDPVNCLADISNKWPHNGILRVEVLTNSSQIHEYTLSSSYNKELIMYGAEIEDEHVGANATEGPNVTAEYVGQDGGVDRWELDEGSWGDGFPYDWLNWSDEKSSTYHNGTFAKLLKILDRLFAVDNVPSHNLEDVHIYEYAVEFGFLRMSPKTRQKLNITTTFVVLDHEKESCFGNPLGKALLRRFLGYDDVLLYSLKQLAADHARKGYCRNVATGDYYKFVDMSVSRFSYVPAAILLVLFTTSISMLLRYSHQQIFIFMVDVLHVLDRTVFAVFPLAPLLTAVLALIGVETLISELFTEASTGFYVILIVWLADQYNVVCCHTAASRRHWIKFFYLYHFIFYAYHYRFNGHFSFVALATSWLFIQHSMIYFFHHYELPAIEHQTQVRDLLVRANRQNPVRGLVTVISQTSPTQISRFTLDTTALEAAVAPAQTERSPSGAPTADQSVADPSARDQSYSSNDQPTLLTNSSSDQSVSLPVQLPVSSDADPASSLTASETEDVHSLACSVSSAVSPDASSESSQTTRDPSLLVPAAEAPGSHRLDSESAATTANALSSCVDSTGVNDVRYQDAVDYSTDCDRESR